MSWFCVKVVISSSSIYLIIDGTSNESNTRKPLTILMSGRDKNDMFWCVPIEKFEFFDLKKILEKNLTKNPRIFFI